MKRQRPRQCSDPTGEGTTSLEADLTDSDSTLLPAIVPTPVTWEDLVAQLSVLREVEAILRRCPPPPAEPGYGKCWLGVMDIVGRIVGPLGSEAYLVARDRLHRVFTDGALRVALSRGVRS